MAAASSEYKYMVTRESYRKASKANCVFLDCVMEDLSFSLQTAVLLSCSKFAFALNSFLFVTSVNIFFDSIAQMREESAEVC